MTLPPHREEFGDALAARIIGLHLLDSLNRIATAEREQWIACCRLVLIISLRVNYDEVRGGGAVPERRCQKESH